MEKTIEQIVSEHGEKMYELGKKHAFEVVLNKMESIAQNNENNAELGRYGWKELKAFVTTPN